MEPHKGVALLLDALVSVEDVHLDIYGDGPERQALETRASQLGLGERARFHGFAPYAELPDIYRGFDAVAVPSLRTKRWVEQFGRVAVEAMASGVPVLASADGSLPEVVGDAGILVPTGDAAAWRAAINRIAADPELRERLGKAGQEQAHRYGWRAIARAQMDFYLDAISSLESPAERRGGVTV